MIILNALIIFIVVLVSSLLVRTDYAEELLTKWGLKEFQKYHIPEKVDLTQVMESLKTLDNVALDNLDLTRAIKADQEKSLEEFLNSMDTDKLIEFIEKQGYIITEK